MLNTSASNGVERLRSTIENSLYKNIIANRAFYSKL